MSEVVLQSQWEWIILESPLRLEVSMVLIYATDVMRRAKDVVSVVVAAVIVAGVSAGRLVAGHRGVEHP